MSCCKDKVVPLDQHIDSRCDCGGEYVDLLNPWYEKGKFLEKGRTPQAIRKYVLEQLKALEI